MKVQTIDFSANAPILKQITAPVNSDYAIGVKIFKDSESVAFEDGQLSVDGRERAATYGGYSVFKLSSDGSEGLKMLDIAADKPDTVETLSVESEATNGTTRVKTVYVGIPLSAYFDGPITIGPHDINADMTQQKLAGVDEEYGEWQDVMLGITEKDTVVSFTKVDSEITGYMQCIQHSRWDTIPSYCWFYRKKNQAAAVIEYGPKTLPLSAEIVAFSVSLGPKKKTDLRASVSLNMNDGLKTNFPFLVQQKDMGYIEVDLPGEPVA